MQQQWLLSQLGLQTYNNATFVGFFFETIGKFLSENTEMTMRDVEDSLRKFKSSIHLLAVPAAHLPKYDDITLCVAPYLTKGSTTTHYAWIITGSPDKARQAKISYDILDDTENLTQLETVGVTATGCI